MIGKDFFLLDLQSYVLEFQLENIVAAASYAFFRDKVLMFLASACIVTVIRGLWL